MPTLVRPNRLVKNARQLATLALAAAGGWIAYSQFGIDHQVALPNAVDAQRIEFTSPHAGRISYYAAHQAAGRPLVLIHSINAAPSTFEVQPLFAYYQGRRPTFALELPGFGFSQRGERPYTPELYAAAISDFLGQVTRPADVVALSLSSEFVTRAALAQPELFHSLVLISPTGFGFTRKDERAAYANQAAAMERVQQFVSVPLWSQPLYDLLTSRPSIRYFLRRSFVGEPPAVMVDYAYATAHQPGARFAPFCFLGGKLFTWDARTSLYGPLTRPTLVLYDRDPNVRFDTLPDLLAQNPHWRAVRIAPSCGLPHWEQLPQTTAALEHFWAEFG